MSKITPSNHQRTAKQLQITKESSFNDNIVIKFVCHLAWNCSLMNMNYANRNTLTAYENNTNKKIEKKQQQRQTHKLVCNTEIV